jgi:hypothetical protein
MGGVPTSYMSPYSSGYGSSTSAYGGYPSMSSMTAYPQTNYGSSYMNPSAMLGPFNQSAQTGMGYGATSGYNSYSGANSSYYGSTTGTYGSSYTGTGQNSYVPTSSVSSSTTSYDNYGSSGSSSSGSSRAY